MTLKDKLIVYCYNKLNSLEYEQSVIREQRRYRTMDSLDMYENMRAQIRIDCFNEFVGDLLRIIGLPTNYTK